MWNDDHVLSILVGRAPGEHGDAWQLRVCETCLVTMPPARLADAVAGVGKAERDARPS